MRATVLSEADFQRQIVELARLQGWLVHHARPAQNRRGQWATPIQGDKGFPDLVLARTGRLILAELKSEAGTLAPGQEAWLTALSSVALNGGGYEVNIWKPSDWPDIERALSRREESC